MTDQEIIRAVADKIMVWDNDGASWHEIGSLVWRIGFDEWNPLTNLNHAFMVAEKMREEGWYCSLNNSDDEWEIEFTKLDGRFLVKEDTYIYGRHQEIGHAICLAALKAKGVEV